MKILTALGLSLALTLSMGVSVFAEEVTDVAKEEEPAEVEKVWHCHDIKANGLMFKNTQWEYQAFKPEKFTAKQKGNTFVILKYLFNCKAGHPSKPDTFLCNDSDVGIFNINITTGKAVMAHTIGWTTDKKVDDIIVRAIQCEAS